MAVMNMAIPSELNEDRISNLPWNVQDIIFGKLPLVDAVRTSVLAKEWRYKWLSLSEFTLNSDVVTSVRKAGDLKWEIVASIINKFLIHHSGPIKTFSLKTYCRTHYPDMYQWFQYLSEQAVEVLIFEEFCREPFEMPSHLFAFKKLKFLFLMNCSLQIPSTFGKFNSLSELILREVSINDDDVEKLIIGCPHLLKLTLLSISGLKQLRIRSSNLAGLLIDCGIQDIVVRSAPSLVMISIAIAFLGPGMVITLNWYSVIRCLSGLISLEKLILSGDFIKHLANNYGLDNFPLRNDTLTSLILHNIRFDAIEVFRVALSLLSSSPNIKNFRLVVESAKGPKLITNFFKEIRGQFCFSELQSMTVVYPMSVGMGSTMNFIEFVIAHSPNLKFLNIEKGGTDMNDIRAARMFARFNKLCPHAEIHYKHRERLLPYVCDDI
ncbi:hypothetical protein BVRB_2g028670 [Beta vulgaris subsp. vulgaris]|nr:hypothetical protein BVRB_2g028670 [Beta vulgaris subsp. vulgaris]